MASSHIVYTNLSSHPSFQKLKDPLKKLILINLVNNEFTSRTGIYQVGSGFLADKVDCNIDVEGESKLIDADNIKRIVINLALKEGVIMYDPLSHIVYIKDFLQMVPYGLSADIISKSVLNEYKMFRHEPFWKHFFDNWGQHTLDYLTASEDTAMKKAQKLFNEKKLRKIEDYITVTENMLKLRNLIEPYISKKSNP